jgi:hypothetical protein
MTIRTTSGSWVQNTFDLLGLPGPVSIIMPSRCRLNPLIYSYLKVSLLIAA